MATNPMQRKSRISFLLGMLLMLIIAVMVVAMMFMKMKTQQEEINKLKSSIKKVYVLNTNVKSGQILTSDMFVMRDVSTSAIPANATTDIISTLASYSLATKDGRAIYFNVGTPGNTENPSYYYVGTAEEKKPIYVTDEQGKGVLASSLNVNDKAYFYEGANNTQRVDVEISSNAVAAKVDMNANTVITGSLITRTEEVVTDDLRKVEYNVISLPVDLQPNEYIDIRLILPNGQNYIVVSKKSVTIPFVGAQYLADTIQMKLTETEILTLSCAIYENYQMKGSKLEAVRYTDAGLQNAAVETYQPNNYVYTLIKNDANIVDKAIKAINERKLKDIDNALNKYGDDGDLSTKVDEGINSTLEQRRNYLQSLTGGQ